MTDVATNGPASAARGVPALSARGLRVSFGGLRALDGIDIDVAPLEIVGIIGPNGAGKTTLFDCLSGFIACQGTVAIGGRDVSKLLPHRRAAAGLGRSFQDARLFPTMTVLDTVRVACELHARGGVLASAFALPAARASERGITARARELIDVLGLGAFREKLVRELSTGTRRIVDLGCVLAQRPSVVMLDEPSSGIAQRETEALGPVLHDVREQTGCAMLLIEHDMPLLLGLAERVYALETGQVIAVGPPGEVVNHPEVIRSYLGADPTAIARSGEAPAKVGPPTPAGRGRRTAPRARATTPGRAGKTAAKRPVRAVTAKGTRRAAPKSAAERPAKRRASGA